MSFIPGMMPSWNRGSTTLPLDDVSSSAAVAYSVRLLRAAYSGNCLRVRRSSDDTEQDIGFASGILDTASLLSFVGANDGFVAKWYDQSTNAKDAAQATNSLQPKIVTAGSLLTKNGLPSVIFTAVVDGELTFSDVAATAAISVVAVAERNGSAANRTIISGGTASFQIRYKATHNAEILRNAQASILTSTSAAPAQLNVLSFAGTTGASLVGVNGTTNSNSTSVAATNPVNTVGDRTTAGISEAFNGGISEVIFFSVQLSSDDRITLEDNAKAYFGVA